MKIAVWKTGHEIADTVAEALAEGFDASCYDARAAASIDLGGFDCHIAYGILRGTKEIFQSDCQWFNVDRGYLNPGHFDGHYRISYRGTQARWHEGIPRKPIDIKLEPWRSFDQNKPVLLCPPTEAVCNFFGYDQTQAMMFERMKLWFNKAPYIRREKGDPNPIDWDNISAVITFNSSVGWQALQRGIPVLSDPNHSIVGSHYTHYGITDMQSLTENWQKMPDTRMELFEAMAAHQFTLQEIREGKAWQLIEHYTRRLSATTVGKSLPQKFAPTPSSAEPNPTYQSSFSNIGS